LNSRVSLIRLPAKIDRGLAARIDPGVAAVCNTPGVQSPLPASHLNRPNHPARPGAATWLALVVAVSGCMSAAASPADSHPVAGPVAVVRPPPVQRSVVRRDVGTPQVATTEMPLAGAATASVPAVRLTPPAPAETPEQIIRDVWPDQLEEHALRIAYRESRFVPTVRNYCCYGLFQIHWKAHRSWLIPLGITGPEQLFDARTNALVAYALYQVAGWAPWSR